MEFGMNGVFWSLSYEGAYYIAIAIIVFARGASRIIALCVLLVLAGPAIIALAPLWFLGYLIYHIPSKWTPSVIVGIFLFIAGAALLFMAPWFRRWLPPIEFAGVRRDLLANYCDGIAFALHLIGIIAIADRVEFVLRPLARIAAWLGSLTFALYLSHRPFIQLVPACPVGDPSSWQQRVWMLGVTFLMVATLG